MLRENIAGTIYNSRPITRRRVKHACKIRVTNEIPRDSRPLIASTRRGYKLLQISSRGRDIWPLFAPLAAVHYHRNRQIRNSPTALFPRVIIAPRNKRRKTTVCPRFPTGVETPVVLFFAFVQAVVRSNDFERRKILREMYHQREMIKERLSVIIAWKNRTRETSLRYCWKGGRVKLYNC